MERNHFSKHEQPNYQSQVKPCPCRTGYCPQGRPSGAPFFIAGSPQGTRKRRKPQARGSFPLASFSEPPGPFDGFKAGSPNRPAGGQDGRKKFLHFCPCHGNLPLMSSLVRALGFCLICLASGALGGAVLLGLGVAYRFNLGPGFVPAWYWAGCLATIGFGYCLVFLARDNGSKEDDNETS